MCGKKLEYRTDEKFCAREQNHDGLCMCQEHIDARRLRIVQVPEDTMLAVMIEPDGEILWRPVFKTLPKGYRVKSVHQLPEYGAFGFVVHSMEFPTVEPGQKIPLIECPIEMQETLYRKIENAD
jgi:hypothetical protein